MCLRSEAFPASLKLRIDLASGGAVLVLNLLHSHPVEAAAVRFPHSPHLFRFLRKISAAIGGRDTSTRALSFGAIDKQQNAAA